jgi:hypothetical protein
MTKHTQRRLPAYVELNVATGLFCTLEGVRGNRRRTEQALTIALAGLEAWRARFADLLEYLGCDQAAGVLQAIDQLRRKMGDS